MSEIKGQLLGILLVLVIFGSVSVALAGVFKTMSDKITEKAGSPETAAEEEFPPVSSNAGDGDLLTY